MKLTQVASRDTRELELAGEFDSHVDALGAYRRGSQSQWSGRYADQLRVRLGSDDGQSKPAA